MRYPPPPEYGYDARTLEVRGIERATQILQLPGAQEAHSFLELGCWDGMVSCYLCRKGKKTTAIDNRDAGFDKRASREGVSFLQMDAADLRFEDESFDFVFSYDGFEHFASPEDVLREAIRVVRKGGYLFLEFGPLYYSPFGEHAYRSITVPYCQILFQKNVINDFANQERLNPIDFSHVNGWSLESYRELWSRYSHVLKRVRYHEMLDLSHLGLISTYPSCFKSKSNYFENFIVEGISVLFQKTDQEFANNGMNSDPKS
jgi:ubiquinone/menaquinone biosynthesis C-methylase UbiE